MTATPPPPFLYEDFDATETNPDGYNEWSGNTPIPPNASYIIDPYNDSPEPGGTSVTLTYDTTPPAPPGSGSNLPSAHAESMAITFASASYAQAAVGINSEYSNDPGEAGGSLDIPAAYTTTGSNLTFWVYFTSDGTMPVYMIPTLYMTGVSGYAHFQNAGANDQILMTQGWQQISCNLTNTNWVPNLPANNTQWTVEYVELWFEYYGTTNPYGMSAVVDSFYFTP